MASARRLAIHIGVIRASCVWRLTCVCVYWLQCLHGRHTKRAPTHTCRRTRRNWSCYHASSTNVKTRLLRQRKKESSTSTAVQNISTHHQNNCCLHKRSVISLTFLSFHCLLYEARYGAGRYRHFTACCMRLGMVPVGRHFAACCMRLGMVPVGCFAQLWCMDLLWVKFSSFGTQ